MRKVTNIKFMFDGATVFNQTLNWQIPVLAEAFRAIRSTAISTTNMNSIWTNFANQTTLNNVLWDVVPARTSASDAAKATLESRGWTATGW
jgi:hypothetical protein